MTIELDHIGLIVSDYARSKAFYLAALKPLGGSLVMEFPAGMVEEAASGGIGVDGKPFFWLTTGGKTAPHLHVAFRAETRDQVDQFYAAAIEAGGTDNGPPGLRLHYHANYYGAFVLDPDGHNVEAVCHSSLAEMNAAARAAAAPRRKKVAKKAAKKTARKAAAKKVAKKKLAPKKAAARKPARKVAAKKAPAKKKVVRKAVGRGRKTKR
jgi:catechol 2,3-dioxygenase-like lactoylglutathione lyase family enzyme